MKIKILTLVLILSLSVHADELLSTVERLYDKDVLNSNTVLDLNHYRKVVRKIVSNHSSNEHAFGDEIFSKMIDGIMLFKPNVSTNEVDDGMSSDVIYNRAQIVCYTLSEMFRIRPDENLCRRIASYIGTIHKVDFPFTLVGNGIGQFFNDPKEFEAFEKRTEAKRKLQTRVFGTNLAIGAYRRRLLIGCNVAVRKLKDTMSEESFNSFTNEIKNLSKADECEMKDCLFRQL